MRRQDYSGRLSPCDEEYYDEFLMPMMMRLYECVVGELRGVVSDCPGADYLFSLGFDEIYVAGVLIELGDPARFPTISKLWSYSDLAPDSDSQSNPRLEFMVDSGFHFLIHSSDDPFYRDLYRSYRDVEMEKAKESGLSMEHADNRAKRKVKKVFLYNLHRYAMRDSGLDEVEPYKPLPKHEVKL
ncbi:MAG TPA: hypothetical protein PKU94_06170 [Candidatus Hydrothermia bacterium]|nr:hypothetical protein [Candidatus Hydrothermia bacterium]